MNAAARSESRGKWPWLPPVSLLLLLAWGCTPAPAEKQPGNPQADQAAAGTGADRATPAQSANETAAAQTDLEAEFPEDPDARVTWDVHFLQGKRVGFRRSVFSPASPGEGLQEIETIDRMEVLRFGQPVRIEVKASTVETAGGDVHEFEYEVPLGEAVSAAKGIIHEGQLVLTTALPRVLISKRPWELETRGFMSVEKSLLEKPMQPGEKRMLRALQIPPLDLVGTLKLEAINFETTKLLVGEFRLLKIEQSLKLADGNELLTTLWTTPEGDILKQEQPAYQMEMYRTTRAVALQPQSTPEFDLGSDVVVRVDPPLNNPHSTRRVVYEVELAGGDPAKVFPQGLSQSVESLRNASPKQGGTARITVRAVRPAEPEQGATPPGDRPTERDLAPSALVQSNDSQVQALIEQALADSKSADHTPFDTAVKIESFVRGHMKLNDFTTVFASAAEVAGSREGDCTEHAVLMAAMCRAAKLPARVAMGLIYYPPSQGFAYHMWTEVWIGDRWLPMDATLGRGGIGAAHLKLGHSSLDGPAAYTSFLPVMQVLGRLKVKVVEVER